MYIESVTVEFNDVITTFKKGMEINLNMMEAKIESICLTVDIYISLSNGVILELSGEYDIVDYKEKEE